MVMAFVEDGPVVVGVVDPEDDLGDGGEAAFVLRGDIEDVSGSERRCLWVFFGSFKEIGRLISTFAEK